MNIMFLAVLVFFFEFIAKLSETIEINLSFGHDNIDDLSSLFEEVLECTVLMNSDAVVLVIAEV
jgi:hypothetical protein